MQEFVVILDRDCVIVDANDAALEVLGLPSGAVGATIPSDVPSAVDSDGKRSDLQEVVRERVLRGEQIRDMLQTHLSADGARRYFMVNGYPIEDADGQVTTALVVGREVTELERLLSRTEEMLGIIKKQARSLQYVIDNMPAGVLLLDSELRLMAWNRVYLHYFEPSPRWKVGVPIEHVLPGAEESGILTRLRRAIKTGRVQAVRNLRYETPRKGITYWQGSAVPLHLRLEDGGDTALAVVVVDVTDQVLGQAHIENIYRHEHAVAEKLQSSFMLNECPKVDGFSLALRYQAALDEALVGGDFYDVFKLGHGRFGIVVGDVAGKGLNAAVYTAMTKYMLRAYALEESSPELVLARLNEALAACTPTEVFVTLIYGVLDADDRSFTYANAGHELPIIYSHATGLATTLDVTGRALALVNGSSYTTQTMRVDCGDAIVLYTDGITDAGRGADRLGCDRLLTAIRDRAHGSAELIADAVLGAALEKCGGQLADDAAIVAIKAVEKESRL